GKKFERTQGPPAVVANGSAESVEGERYSRRSQSSRGVDYDGGGGKANHSVEKSGSRRGNDQHDPSLGPVGEARGDCCRAPSHGGGDSLCHQGNYQCLYDCRG